MCCSGVLVERILLCESVTALKVVGVLSVCKGKTQCTLSSYVVQV